MTHLLYDVASQAITHLPVPCIVSLGSTTEIVAVNDAAAELFGYDRREEMLSLDVATITAPAFRSELSDNDSITLRDGLTTVKAYVRKDGSVFPAQLFARPMAGHPDLAIGVIVDLELSDALRAAEPASI